MSTAQTLHSALDCSECRAQRTEAPVQADGIPLTPTERRGLEDVLCLTRGAMRSMPVLFMGGAWDFERVSHPRGGEHTRGSDGLWMWRLTVVASECGREDGARVAQMGVYRVERDSGEHYLATEPRARTYREVSFRIAPRDMVSAHWGSIPAPFRNLSHTQRGELADVGLSLMLQDTDGSPLLGRGLFYVLQSAACEPDSGLLLEVLGRLSTHQWGSLRSEWIAPLLAQAQSADIRLLFIRHAHLLDSGAQDCPVSAERYSPGHSDLGVEIDEHTEDRAAVRDLFRFTSHTWDATGTHRDLWSPRKQALEYDPTRMRRRSSVPGAPVRGAVSFARPLSFVFSDSPPHTPAWI